MKRIVVATIVFLFSIVPPILATVEDNIKRLDDTDGRIIAGSAKLKEEVDLLGQNQARIIKGTAGLKKDVEELKKTSGPDILVYLQRKANRALAWGLSDRFITSQGNYPDIEEVEAMLTPILESCNMKPAPFEQAVWEAAKKRGWTYLDKPFMGLSEQKVQEIANAAAKKEAGVMLTDAKAYTDQKAQATVASLKTIEDGIASLRKDLEGTASLQSQLANKADKSALDSFRNQVLDEKGNPLFVERSEFAGLKDQVVDENGKLKVAKTEIVELIYTSLDERIKRSDSRIGTLESATTYLSQKKWDEAKAAMFLAYGRDGLRALGWSEKEISKAEEKAGKMGIIREPAPQLEEGGAAEEAY